MEKSTELGMSFCSSKTRKILTTFLDDIKIAGKNQHMVAHVEEIDEKY